MYKDGSGDTSPTSPVFTDDPPNLENYYPCSPAALAPSTATFGDVEGFLYAPKTGGEEETFTGCSPFSLFGQLACPA